MTLFKEPILFLYIGLPLIILLIFLLKKEFIKLDKRFQDEAAYAKKRKKARLGYFFSRSIIILLLVAALATPILETQIFSETTPKITVLIDNSTSMEVLDTSPIEQLINDLEDHAPVDVELIGTGNSAVGDDLLNHLRRGQNLLLVSDGHVQEGASLRTVTEFAGTINATINAISLQKKEDDASVYIVGPSKTVDGINNSYLIRITKTHSEPVDLRVMVDGEIIFEDSLSETAFTFIETFDQGDHVITASISGEDYFPENNEFSKTVRVVDKPKVLFVTNKQSGVQKIVEELYSVETVASLPTDLSPYYAVILNDIDRNRIDANNLASFITEGDGLVVIGGQSSYDYGRYKDSILETLLPVTVGAGSKGAGGANIVISIDLSSSTQGAIRQERRMENGELVYEEIVTTEQVQSLEKALAISVIEDLNPSNRLGILGFTFKLPGNTPEACSGACVVQPVIMLGKNKESIIDKVSRIDVGGGTALWIGMEGALEMLSGISGSKNIIFISDGISSPTDRDRALNAARATAAMGGKVYAVQVGSSEEGAAFLQLLAQAGNGIFFRATQANKLTILFGEPVDIDQGDAFDIFVLNQHHFITQGIEPRATLFGYNQVAPKKGSQVLVTSNGGDPVLTVWNYGIGRVASITAFNGPDLGQLLTADNSKLLSRTINWAIGDPERKAAYSISFPDGRVGEELSVNITTDKVITDSDISLERLNKDVYTGTIYPDSTGVFSSLGTTYAVNYERELGGVGMKPSLASELSVSNGKIFSPDDIKGIIEHVQTQQQLTRTEQEELSWLLVLAALLVYVIEVSIRRIKELLRS